MSVTTLANKKVYVVAPGHSFVTKGRTYKPGDVITPNVFPNVTTFNRYVQKKWIITREEYENLTGRKLSIATTFESSEIEEVETIQETKEEVKDKKVKKNVEAEAKVDALTKEASKE